MYENRRQSLLSRRAFVQRLARHGIWALLLVLGSLLLGTVGFHVMSRQPWLDAFLNSAMLLGGIVLLALSTVSGEPNPLPDIPLRAGFALLYLIVGGSLIAFTAFVWLLARMPATRVATHAYVNPVVAVALGYFVAGEELTLRTVLASTLIVLSVILSLGSVSKITQH